MTKAQLYLYMRIYLSKRCLHGIRSVQFSCICENVDDYGTSTNENGTLRNL